MNAIVWFVFGTSALLVGKCTGQDYTNINYAVIVDAGSSGTRGFVFRYLHEYSEGEKPLQSYQAEKVEPGLSTFASKPAEVVDYLMPVLVDAAKFIPEEYRTRASLYIKGTGGMRLLSEHEQEGIWDAIYSGLKGHPDFMFKLKRINLGTIDGHLEAYYAVMSSNYIAGSIDASLLQTQGSPMINALDMGGASTQMTLYTGHDDVDTPLRQSDFWSHSWLEYGVDTIRARALSHLLANSLHFDEESVIQNPCTFVGHTAELDGRTLLGTGEAEQCVELIREVLWPEEETDDCMEGSACSIGGIVHPPVSGEFYAMSVYFYALDCIRHFTIADSNVHWPRPTINEIYSSTISFCSQNWTYMDTHGRENKHAYTSHRQLPNRCLEGLYMAVLLEHVFGFHDESRSITLALTVKGTEVEWTLGFALTEVVFPPPNPDHDEHEDHFEMSADADHSESENDVDLMKKDVPEWSSETNLSTKDTSTLSSDAETEVHSIDTAKAVSESSRRVIARPFLRLLTALADLFTSFGMLLTYPIRKLFSIFRRN